MPEENNQPETNVTPSLGAEEAPIVDAAETGKTQKVIEQTDNEQAIKEVSAKIKECENILVALSNDPSVDDIAAAIGLTMALDKMGKHATAIYSGVTPNVLQFLEPEKTLEENADSLQDLVIALNKEKADHLRYKVDGEFVKIYITPYRTKLSEDDLSYSYGDYNVDLVIALDVQTATSLDNVLREHGRIMHDASAIDITTGAPGRFGEIEWSNPAMSSVSEMVTDLLLGMKAEMDETIATSLLAGIVGATERFKNEHTMADTMKVAARLMEHGANAQLVAENIAIDGEEEAAAPDAISFDVNHGEVEPEVEEEVAVEPEPEPELPKAVDTPVLDDDLMAELQRQKEEAEKPAEEEMPAEGVKDYGKMIDEALAEVNGAEMVPAEPAPEAPVADVMSEMAAATGHGVTLQPEGEVAAEPEAVVAPEPMAEPEPVMPMPDDTILPPPPAPEVDFNQVMPEVQEPAVVPEPVVQPEPVAQPELAAQPEPVLPAEAVQPTANPDPSQFRIPGM